ncbi:MAG: hypothetical protein PHW82_00535 [Bacteroidales bacterium]|nr:hypothetical protein [Bacteroidales bacterium]
MQNNSLIKKNILKFIEYQGITKYEFYKKTGITRGVLDKNTGLSEENTTKFLAYYTEVSPSWLLFGKEPMLIDTVPKSDQVSQLDAQNIEEPLYKVLNKALEERILEKDLRIKELNETIAMQQDYIATLKQISRAGPAKENSPSTKKEPKSTHQS